MAAAMGASAIAGVPAIAVAVLQYSPAFALLGSVTMLARAGLIGCQRAAALAFVCLGRQALCDLCSGLCSCTGSGSGFSCAGAGASLFAFLTDNLYFGD